MPLHFLVKLLSLIIGSVVKPKDVNIDIVSLIDADIKIFVTSLV